MGGCPNLLHAFPPLFSFPPPKDQTKQPASQSALAELKRRSNVSGTVHPFNQGEGGGSLGGAPAPRMPVVVRGDQELQGGGAHPETRCASSVATAADAAQDTGSVHTTDTLTAPDPREAGSSSATTAAS